MDAGGEHCSQLVNRKVVRRGFEGAICLFPAGSGHSQWMIEERLNFLHIYFDSAGFDEGLKSSFRYGADQFCFREVFQEPCPVISSAVQSIAHADWNDPSLSLGIDGLMNWIFLNAIRTYAGAPLEAIDRRGRFSRLHATLLMDYLRENLSEPVRLEALAQLCNLSRYHFLRKFKNTFGNSPHAYLTQLRMGRARDLLVQGKLKITSVALECGYSQHSQFSTAFKRHFGHSPSDVRGRS
ncbi:MAG: helix-turn-helix domain-containing protein [Janthinobacterium lividum]